MNLPFSERIRAVPVSRALLCLVTGIVAGRRCGQPVPDLPVVIFILLVLLAATVHFNLFFRPGHAWLRGLLISLVFIFLGGYRSAGPGTMAVPIADTVTVGSVCSFPVEKDRSVLVKLCINARTFADNDAGGPAFVNAYFGKSDSILRARPGDMIIFHSGLDVPVNGGNPDEFDYASYLRSKGIVYQCFISDGHWRLMETGRRKPGDIPLLIRQRLLQRIEDTPGDEAAKSVLEAITLGTRENLDPELKSAYANAGGIHVMAVSGLHVGMLWLFLSWLTVFLRYGKSNAMARFILITGVLWFYAVMTGLSASVTRSCLMFSLVSLGKLIDRNSSTLNTVMVAAFIQLLFKPALIDDAGFRFSYLAVTGILLFHAGISGSVKVKGFIPGKIRDLVAVSLSAQLLTYPLGIYYFHQFPVWFLLTNIFIIPVVTALVLLYLLSVMFFFFPLASFILTRGCLLLAGTMNHGIRLIDGLPWSVVGGLTLNGFQVAVLLVVPLLILAWTIHRPPALIISVQVLIFLFILTGVVRRAYHSAGDCLAVYNVRGLPAVGMLSGETHRVYTDTGEPSYQRSIEYAAKSFWINTYMDFPLYRGLRADSGLSLTESRLPGCGNLLVQEPGMRAVLISDAGSLIRLKTGTACRADALILTGRDLLPPGDLLRLFRPRRVIISSSVPGWKSYTEVEMRMLPPVYDVRKKGWYVLPYRRSSGKK